MCQNGLYNCSAHIKIAYLVAGCRSSIGLLGCMTIGQAPCFCFSLTLGLLLAAVARKKAAKAEKKKAKEAALKLPAIAEDKAGPSHSGNAAATPEAASQGPAPAEAAAAKPKQKRKKGQQEPTLPEQQGQPGLDSISQAAAANAKGIMAEPTSPTGPSQRVSVDAPALASTSQHPAASAKRTNKRSTVTAAGVGETSPVNGVVNSQAEATPITLTAAHPHAEVSPGLANGHHSFQHQPSPAAGMPVRPYLPPVDTHDDSAAGWTMVNGHQRHADPATAYSAPADPVAQGVAADARQADAPWGEQPMEDPDQEPEEEKIGLAALEGQFPLRRRGVRAGRRHKKRYGNRDTSTRHQTASEHSDDDSDYTARGCLAEGQLPRSPLAGQPNSWGIPDASNSPVRGIGLPPGLHVANQVASIVAEQKLRQTRRANAIQAAVAAEAAKQDAVQRAHVAAETRRQAVAMALQEPAEDAWPALPTTGSSSGQPAYIACCSPVCCS